MADVVMHLVHEIFDTGRPLVRSQDLVVQEPGSLNYHCAGCGTLLVRDAGADLPDVVVICPVCLELNEAQVAATIDD